MSLDYLKKTYKPNRPDSRLRTTYASMSQWVNSPAAARAQRPGLPAGLIAQNNPSPQFSKKRPRGRGLHQYTYMRHDMLPPDPRMDARRDALDDTIPVHARFSVDNGYDDYHKAYRAAKIMGPPEDFPLWGPPRLRHGRQGGSWRHVKEVLQAGGNRIVFVDGQVSVKDTQDVSEVPGANLILSSAQGPHLSHQLDNMLRLSHPARLTRSSKSTGRNMGRLTAVKGMEKNNWNVIR